DGPRDFEEHAAVNVRANAFGMPPPILDGEIDDQAGNEQRKECGEREQEEIQRIHSRGHRRCAFRKERRHRWAYAAPRRSRRIITVMNAPSARTVAVAATRPARITMKP